MWKIKAFKHIMIVSVITDNERPQALLFHLIGPVTHQIVETFIQAAMHFAKNLNLLCIMQY